jgi:structural maintenance of chromosome 2
MPASATKVSELFCSCSMNVNNPHFLIMQGRVTKVLNMKPREILLMIEEAAGVRVYENKRRTALNTIEKKSTKIENMNKVFHVLKIISLIYR